MTTRSLDKMLATPKAKRGKQASAIVAVLRGQHVTEDVPAFGTTYTIRTLDPWEKDSAGRFVKSGSAYQAGQMVPRGMLAVALVALRRDGEKVSTPVEEEFALPDELEPDVRVALQEDLTTLREWREQQVFEWLGETDEAVVQTLWKQFLALEFAKKQRLEALTRPFVPKLVPAAGTEPSTKTPSSVDSGSGSGS